MAAGPATALRSNPRARAPSSRGPTGGAPGRGGPRVCRGETARGLVDRLDADAVDGPGVRVVVHDRAIGWGDEAEAEEGQARDERARGEKPDPRPARAPRGWPRHPHPPPVPAG